MSARFVSRMLVLVLPLMAIVVHILLTGGVAHSVASQSDIHLETELTQHEHRQTVRLDARLTFLNAQRAQIQTVRLIVSGPQGFIAHLPLNEGGFDISGQSGIPGILTGGMGLQGVDNPLPGLYKSVASSAAIAYGVLWTPDGGRLAGGNYAARVSVNLMNSDRPLTSGVVRFSIKHPTPTPTATATRTPIPSPTATPTLTPSPQPTDIPTATPTITPTFTATSTSTPMPTATQTPTLTPAATSISSLIPNATPIASLALNATLIPTATPSIIPTLTPTQASSDTTPPMPAPSLAATPTQTPSPTPSASPTHAPAVPPTPASSLTAVLDGSPSQTPFALVPENRENSTPVVRIVIATTPQPFTAAPTTFTPTPAPVSNASMFSGTAPSVALGFIAIAVLVGVTSLVSIILIRR